MHRSAFWSKASVKASSVFLALVLLTSSCSSADPQVRLAELTDRVCQTMKTVGYDFTESTIQALDEAVQEQLLADIAEIEKIDPSRLSVPLARLCNYGLG